MPMSKQDLYRSIAFPTAYTLEEERKAQEIKDRSDREKTALTMYPKLIEQYTPEETDSIMRRFIEGEGINTPTMRGQLLPPPGKGDTDPYSPQNITFNEGGRATRGSTLEPINFKQSETVMVNPYTGERFAVPGKNVKSFGADDRPVDVNVVDADTREMTNIGKASKGSKVVIKPRPVGGKGPKSAKEFQDQVALGVLKNYFTLDATGGDVEKARPAAISAAKRFGMTIDQVKEDPSIWQRISGQEGDTIESPSFTPPGERADNDTRGTGETYGSAKDVQSAYKAGKISKEQAASILRKDFGMK